ncbi:hypothetical protein HanXRQr2_Chr10g0454931 [Helianthus annuus]|uniref:Uncharacterized protein n=1 Tax=Helianthus annuus TaxID=4232 RepID=A0A9K3N5H8_HELAN|nr:hypothetical protein HanXRQr2_Chr10g0454931 [Helianthus annuus]KAJ0884913.1 hypothetical protein HanPSC8_Chr10g0439331 [Helianthus annuus]
MRRRQLMQRLEASCYFFPTHQNTFPISELLSSLTHTGSSLNHKLRYFYLFFCNHEVRL